MESGELMKVGDLVHGLTGRRSSVRSAGIGIITHMSNQLGPDHAWVYVTVSWPDIGPQLEMSNHLEVINESR